MQSLVTANQTKGYWLVFSVPDMHLCISCIHLIKGLAAKIPFHSLDARQPLFSSEDNLPVPRTVELDENRSGLGWFRSARRMSAWR